MTVENLKSMGYDAELREGVYQKGARAGQARKEVHIKTGAPVDVFMDFSDEETPKFFSFAHFTLDGIAKSKGGYNKADYIKNKKEGGLEKYNQEQGFEFARRYQTQMLAAYGAARDGSDLSHYVSVFKLDNYKTRGQTATTEADLGDGFDGATDFATPTAREGVPVSRPRTTTPSGLGQ